MGHERRRKGIDSTITLLGSEIMRKKLLYRRKKTKRKKDIKKGIISKRVTDGTTSSEIRLTGQIHGKTACFWGKALKEKWKGRRATASRRW